MKSLLIVLVVLAVLAGGGWFLWGRGAQGPQFKTAKVEKGDLLIQITATGAVQPVTQVQVGTQVSGTIQTLGADFNTRVTKGQVIAQIDPSLFQAHLNQDKANYEKSMADVDRVKAQLKQAERELARNKNLFEQKLVSDSDLDVAQANYDSLIAQVKVAEATVVQNKAAMDISQVNLDYTRIVSPVDGVVISRNVDVGQTVAASLAAPTLFVIANDLKKIQIQASVAEADIGKVSEGQSTTFGVDAFRERTFPGKVSQRRLSPTTVQNVVTYTVLIDADNPEEKLFPGMTANVSFEVQRLKDVLKVPNAALRFIPPGQELPDTAKEGGKEAAQGGGPPGASGDGGRRWQRGDGSGSGDGGHRGPRDTASPAPGDGGEGDKKPDHPHGKRGAKGHVWIQTPTGPKVVMITIGPSDGSFTEVVEGDLKEGQEVLTGLVQESKGAATTNPFMPQMGGGRGGR